MARIRLLLRRLDADADDLLRRRRVAHVRARHLSLRARDVTDRPRRSEQLRPDAEAQRGVKLEVREQDAALGRDRESLQRGGVKQREEDERVVIAMLPLDEIHQSRRRGAQPPHPLDFVLARLSAGEHAARQLPEGDLIVELVDREPPDEDAAHTIRPLHVLVLPRQRIPRGGGQHVHVVTFADLLGEQPRRVFGSAADFRAVSRGDERKLHACASCRTGPVGSAATTSAAGGRMRRRRANQPGSCLHRGNVPLAAKPFEHGEVLALDHGPIVVALVIRQPVPSEIRRQDPVAEQGVERGGEFTFVPIIQTGVAAEALAHQHVAPGVGEHRAAECPRFERDHGQAFVARRHHERLGRGQCIELVAIAHVAEVTNAGVRWNRKDRRPNQHQVERPGAARRVLREKVEQLLAPLVGVDPADVDDEGAVQAELLPRPLGRDIGWNLGPDANDNAGDVLVPGDGVDERALLERVVHDGAHSAENRAKQCQTQCRVALHRWDEHRAIGNRARTMVGVVISRAEEQDEVEVASARAQARHELAADGPFAVQPLQLFLQRVDRVEYLVRATGEFGEMALPRDRKALDPHAVDLGDSLRKLVAPGEIVARTGGQHAHLGVLAQPLRDVSCVQLCAAVDLSAVALHDDRKLHPSTHSPRERCQFPAPNGCRATNSQALGVGSWPS